MSENMVEALHNNDMLYLVLGSLISSDSINSKEDAEKSLNSLSMIEKELNSSNIEDTKKSEYKDMIKKCYGVLEEELKRFK